MFVCLCNAVTDREIRQQAAQGVDTLDELRLRTGCSDCCGQCAEEAETILMTARPRAARRVTLPLIDVPQPA